MVPSPLRSDVLERAQDGAPEPFTVQSLQARLASNGREVAVDEVRDACVSLVIEGELDVVANGSNRQFKHASGP